MRSDVRACLLALALCLGAAGRLPATEVIDRILAVVSGQIITLSDIRGVVSLGLAPADRGPDEIRVVLDWLIDRRLILVEVERYAPPEPEPEALARQAALVRARFPSDQAFEAALAAAGFSSARLRSFLRDDLRIRQYLDQRFAAAARPTDQEVVRHYRDREARFLRNGELPPFEEIQDRVRDDLAAERRQDLIAEWVSGLRRRAEVTVLYLPARGEDRRPGISSGRTRGARSRPG